MAQKPGSGRPLGEAARPKAEEQSKRLGELKKMGPRPNVLQIVPTRPSVRPFDLRDDDHELVTRPLAAPTGPGGASGFRNRAGSQISVPQVMNIYMGPFWDDRAFVESFSKAIVENGYLDPLAELNCGTGSGVYLGSVDGDQLEAGSVFLDSDARAALGRMLDAGVLSAAPNSLFMLILPDGVTSQFDGDGSQSCAQFCGYHDALLYQGVEVAYAVLPSTKCDGCGGLVGDFTAVYAHELAEACTDKVPGQGWVADDGEENGDLEAWILFGWGPPNDPSRFLIQGYYTNERGNTVGAWRDVTQAAAQTHARAAGLRGPTPSPEDVFEIAGRKVLLKGTSGPAKEPARIAEGKPIRHDLIVGGRTIPAAGTSGASQKPFRVATGRPVQNRLSLQIESNTKPTGSGQIVGHAVRRA